MKNKVLDLRTERGLRIFQDISNAYPSVQYGLKDASCIFISEGYTHIITKTGKIIKMI